MNSRTTTALAVFAVATLTGSAATARESITLFNLGPARADLEKAITARLTSDGRFDLRPWGTVAGTFTASSEALAVAEGRRKRLRDEAQALIDEGNRLLEAFELTKVGDKYDAALDKLRLAYSRPEEIATIVSLHRTRASFYLAVGQPRKVQGEFEAILALRPDFVLREARPSLVSALTRAKQAIAGVRAFSTVVVSTPSGAEISLDGKPVGTTPVTLNDVPPGVHYVVALKAGHLPWARAEDFNPDRTEAVRADLVQIQGATARHLSKTISSVTEIEAHVDLVAGAAQDLEAPLVLFFSMSGTTAHFRLYDSRRHLFSELQSPTFAPKAVDAALSELLAALGPTGLVTLERTVETRVIERLATEKPGEPTAWYQHWWVWAGAGALIVGGAVTAALLIEKVNPAPAGYEVQVVLP